MKVNANRSAYQESPDASREFDRHELRRCRLLLRRLRFLEGKALERDGRGYGSNSDAFVDWEAEALEWVLSEVGFLDEKKERI